MNVRVLFKPVSPATHHHAIASRVILCLRLVGLIKEHVIATTIISVLLCLIHLLVRFLIEGAHVSCSVLSHQAVVIYKIGYIRINDYHAVETPYR